MKTDGTRFVSACLSGCDMKHMSLFISACFMFYFFTVHRKVKQNLKVTTASVKQGQRDELFPAGFTRNCTLICASPQRIRQNEQCKTSPKWWNYSWNSPSGIVCSVLSSPWVNGAGSEVRREGEWTVTVLRRLSVLKWSELDWNFRIWAWPARARARVCMCVCLWEWEWEWRRLQS